MIVLHHAVNLLKHGITGKKSTITNATVVTPLREFVAASASPFGSSDGSSSSSIDKRLTFAMGARPHPRRRMQFISSNTGPTTVVTVGKLLIFSTAAGGVPVNLHTIRYLRNPEFSEFFFP
jgi:hypothetical protein